MMCKLAAQDIFKHNFVVDATQNSLQCCMTSHATKGDKREENNELTQLRRL